MTSPTAEPVRPSDAVAGLCRLAFDLRILAATLTMVWLLAEREGDGSLLVLPLLASSVLSFAAVMRWERFGRWLLVHPAWLVVEMAGTALVLVRAGVASPFLYFTLATALLAGTMYSWAGAAVFSALLTAAALAATVIDAGMAAQGDRFHALLVVPALYPSFATAGAALRRVLLRQAAQGAALAEAATRSAAADERARLARDMHDSVAKTLHGIALAATALAATAARRPETVPDSARQLASAARTAADEARALIVDLRAGDGGDPVSAVVERVASAWAARTGVPADVAVETVVLAPGPSLELVRIAEEALTNIERYARATRVRVTLVARDGQAVLAVRDDGIGFVVPAVLARLGDTGHFGLLGAQERARRANGELSVSSQPGQGTALRATVPLGPAVGVDAAAATALVGSRRR